MHAEARVQYSARRGLVSLEALLALGDSFLPLFFSLLSQRKTTSASALGLLCLFAATCGTRPRSPHTRVECASCLPPHAQACPCCSLCLTLVCSAVQARVQWAPRDDFSTAPPLSAFIYHAFAFGCICISMVWITTIFTN